jgi:hypothetical protein
MPRDGMKVDGMAGKRSGGAKKTAKKAAKKGGKKR